MSIIYHLGTIFGPFLDRLGIMFFFTIWLVVRDFSCHPVCILLRLAVRIFLDFDMFLHILASESSFRPFETIILRRIALRSS